MMAWSAGVLLPPKLKSAVPPTTAWSVGAWLGKGPTHSTSMPWEASRSVKDGRDLASVVAEYVSRTFLRSLATVLATAAPLTTAPLDAVAPDVEEAEEEALPEPQAARIGTARPAAPTPKRNLRRDRPDEPGGVLGDMTGKPFGTPGARAGPVGGPEGGRWLWTGR